MFVESRDDSRRFFLQVWQKMAGREVLEPLEALVAQVIAAHPEYHATLADPALALEAGHPTDEQGSNPFLHMGLHVALREQLQVDRPSGIVELYRRLLQSSRHDVHRAEHRIMDCLEHALRDAGRRGTMPDEAAYLDCVRKHVA